MSTSPTTIEDSVNEWLRDVSDRLGTERIADIFGGILIGAARTKGTIEKSLDSLLVYTNIPTRSEHVALAASVEQLGDRVEALGKRVEVLARRLEAVKTASKQKTATTAAATRSKSARPRATSKTKPARKGRK